MRMTPETGAAVRAMVIEKDVQKGHTVATAETTTGTFLSADVCSQPKEEQESGGVSVPEELAELCVKRLLEEIYRQVLPADNYCAFQLVEDTLFLLT